MVRDCGTESPVGCVCGHCEEPANSRPEIELLDYLYAFKNAETMNARLDVQHEIEQIIAQEADKLANKHSAEILKRIKQQFIPDFPGTYGYKGTIAVAELLEIFDAHLAELATDKGGSNEEAD